MKKREEKKRREERCRDEMGWRLGELKEKVTRWLSA